MIATILKVTATLMLVGGLFLAVHELNQMMDSSNPVTSGVVLAPINAR